MISKFAYNAFLALAVTTLIVSCSSKQKKDDAAGAGTEVANDANIVNKELSFDTSGSDSGKIDGLYSINYEYDQSSLTAEAKKRLGDNAKWMKSKNALTVQIEGHTDERGSIEYNLALGERRAKAAKAYLVSLGIEGKRMSVISYGEEKPLVTGNTEDAFSKNRRANFVPLPAK